MLFSGLDRDKLMEVAALIEERTIEADEELLTEGESARYLYLVVSGRGAAQLQTARGWLSLGMVGPRDVAGWSSLVEGSLYPASVKALTEMQVARVEGKALTLLMSLRPAIGHAVNKGLSAIFSRQYQSALEAFKLGR